MRRLEQWQHHLRPVGGGAAIAIGHAESGAYRSDAGGAGVDPLESSWLASIGGIPHGGQFRATFQDSVPELWCRGSLYAYASFQNFLRE
jgi:hypothetical protein